MSGLAAATASDLGAVRVHRHGAVLALDHGAGATPVEEFRTLTRRGSQRAFARTQRELLDRCEAFDLSEAYPADDADAVRLIAARIESGVIVERVTVPLPPPSDGPGGGVREPRRPTPPHDSATALASPDDA